MTEPSGILLRKAALLLSYSPRNLDKEPILMRAVLFVTVMSFAVTFAVAQKTEFSGEQAYTHLKVLAGEIGPRPMGSPAEHRALEYAVSKFREYGCEEAYIMPMTVAHGVNTTSGVAVGIRKGKTGRSIVVGGHIDSAGPDIPGANDDGSGAACVIELARVLCKRENVSTAIFCCWGGEEQGLRGSQYFVDHFPLLDSVALMLQIDMTDGAGVLYIDPDGPFQISAPRWLTRAAFEEALNNLGYTDVLYPTHSSTLNSVGPAGTGSDHEPFLEKGIPAIDFTSDVAYPIHTPLDNLQNFAPSGLARSGDITLNLFKRFDGGTPDRITEKYFLFQIGSLPVFLTYPLLWVALAVTLLVGMIALFVTRNRRLVVDPDSKIRWSGIKMLLFMIIVQTFVWSSENVVGLIKGLRFPWVNNYNGFVVLGILGGFVGIWLMFRLAGRWRITNDPYVLYLRAFLILSIYGILLALSGPELALYPAFALLCVALAMLVRNPLMKFVLAVISPYMVLHLAFGEHLGLWLRLIASTEIDSFAVTAIIHAGLILVFTILLLPIAYGFAAVYRDAGVELKWLERFRTTRGLLFTLLIFGALTAFLTMTPTYNRLWQRVVQVEQQYHLGSDSSSVTVQSTEYMEGLDVKFHGADTLLHGKVNSFRPALVKPEPVRWLTVKRHDEAIHDAADSLSIISRKLVLSSARRPYIVELKYESSGPVGAETPWSEGALKSSRTQPRELKQFTWYSFPDTPLEVPVKLSWKRGTPLAETITVTYDSLEFPMTVSQEFTTPIYRTIVTSTDTVWGVNFNSFTQR